MFVYVIQCQPFNSPPYMEYAFLSKLEAKRWAKNTNKREPIIMINGKSTPKNLRSVITLDVLDVEE